MAELPLLEDVTLTTEYCRYCLMCRHVCPVGLVTHEEKFTPHGWGLTIASVKRGLLDWNTETVDALYTCADCGMCQSFCVSSQPLPDAIAAARAQVVEAGFAPDAVLAVRRSLEAHSSPSPVAATQDKGDIAIFVGEDAARRQGVVDAALRLLAAIGIQPVLIGNGRNNGDLPTSLGFRDQGRDLALQTHDEFIATGAQILLVLSPGDLYAIRDMYSERLGLALPEGAEVVEVVTVLANALAIGQLPVRRREGSSVSAYLDPTHAVRSGRNPEAPRALLAAVLGEAPRELFWSQKRGQPSGATSLRYTHPAIAELLARSRLADARNAGVATLFTEAVEDMEWLNRFAAEYGIIVANLFEELVVQIG